MSEPFVFIASYGIKPEFRDSAAERLREVASVVEEQEPQLSSFLFYLDPERSRTIVVQVHPDGDSMATHMAVVANHIADAWDWLDLEDSQEFVLGTPPKVLTDYWAEFNVHLDTYPTFVAGFDRAAASATVG